MREVQTWREAFDLGPSEHIALVGGGGKTTTLWSMARELAGSARTIATSTTKAGVRPAEVAFVAYDLEVPDHTLHDAVSAAFAQHALVAVGSGARADRLERISVEVADELFLRSGARYVINEADGARMKPFKAPAEHEPVIASTTSLMVVVVGLDAVGAPIDEDNLHRPERIRELTGAAKGAKLSVGHIAAIVRAYEAKCKDVDESARFALLINKADRGTDVPEVRSLERALHDVELSALVAAAQTPEATRRWRLR